MNKNEIKKNTVKEFSSIFSHHMIIIVAGNIHTLNHGNENDEGVVFGWKNL